MNRLTGLLAATACGALVGLAPCGGEGADGPYVQWVGAESAHEAGFVVVRDDAAWRELWGRHTGTAAADGGAMRRYTAPAVNFDRCIVVAFFRGSTTNEDGEVVEAVEETGEQVRIRFSSTSFQTSGMDGSGGAVKTTPFGIWVLPATDRAIVVEEGRASLKGQALQWREVHRFDAR